jgi:spermidine/putrescine transport system substrate-binding protein
MLLPACGGSTAGSSATSSASPTLAPAEVDGDLNLYMWQGYVPDTVLKGFENEYGVKINQTFFGSETEMLAKVAAGVEYDAVVIASNYLTRAVPYLRPVNHDAMTNWADQVLPGFKVPPYDPDPKVNEMLAPYVGVPYAAGGIGVAWLNEHMGTSLPDTFSVFWDLKDKAKGHITLFSDQQFTIAMALAKLGYSINSSNPDEVNAAADALIELKPYISAFGPAAVAPVLQSGDGWLNMAWSGDIYYSLTSILKPAEAQGVGFQMARESLIYNNDNWVIPKSSAHPGTATLYYDWLLAPENMAQCPPAMGYVVPTKAGVEAYNEMTKDYPFLAVNAEQLYDTSQWIAALTGDNLKVWQDAWVRVTA